ncbi:MAG: ComEC/Rec2 family competence protein [Deltaproteobacteria bacterium]|nr:ComEC/Rec2 family competence protein [Deltaproteobacteria bacterium]
MQLLTIWVLHNFTSFFARDVLLPKGPGPYHCEGEILKEPQIFPEKIYLVVRLDQCAARPDWVWGEARGTVRLYLKGPDRIFFRGERIRFRASFRPPSEFKNPGSFRARRYYLSTGIDALGSISDPRWVVALQGPDRGPSWLETLRHRLRRQILKADEGDRSGLLLALLLGQRQNLSVTAVEAFRQTGTAHVLAISGLHVSLVALFFCLFFRLWSGLPPFSNSIRFLRFYPLLVIVPVWAYVAGAGLPASAVRAGIMASLFLVGLSVWRKTDPLSIWALAAFLILVFEPFALFQAGFQLSFMAVLFMILFLRGRRHWLFDLAAISFLALAGVGPLLLHHFNNVSGFGLLANIIILPMISFVLMPLVVLGWLFTGVLGIPFDLLWEGGVWAAGIVLKVNAVLAGYAESFIYHGAVSFWQLVCYYGAFFLLAWKRWVWKRRLVFFVPMMALVFWGGKMPYDGKLRVTFVDVGQGDCAVVQIPNGKVWVIDGGGIRGSDWDVGRFVVAPYLWSRGIRQVHRLFLSHPHHDHFKGLGFLAEKFEPQVLYATGDAAPEAEAEEWQ